MKRLFLLLTCFLFCLGVSGNNLRIPGVVRVISVKDGVAELSVPVQWDHSWRDSENFDGVWLYLKYRQSEGDGGVWRSAVLEGPSGLRESYSAGSGSFTLQGDSLGVFVYRSASGSGSSVVEDCRLYWRLPAELSGETVSSLSGSGFQLVVQGVEMVFIPHGPFYAGDGESDYSLCSSGGGAVGIYGEGDKVFHTLNPLAGGGVSVSPDSVLLSSSYPSGYRAFWCMKYEVSQEQLVSFLNMLPEREQLRVLGKTKLYRGNYVFGSSSVSSYRNGLYVREECKGDQGYVFGCNLDGADGPDREGDGQTLACNYMTPRLLVSYSSWTGLRPMSELEYEKACRPLCPFFPVGGEYAWNSSRPETRSFLIGVEHGGTDREVAVGGNVNAGGVSGINGPVRCGIFAASSSLSGGESQSSSGGSYWGVMELSGNVGELCARVSNTSLRYDVHGDGTGRSDQWGDENGFGVRGGSYALRDNYGALRISDRSGMVWQNRSDAGFRCVRSFSADVPFDGGELTGPEAAVCSGSEVEITGSAATLRGRETAVLYSWWMSEDGGEHFRCLSAPSALPEALSLTTQVENASLSVRAYVLRRVASCVYGEASADFVIKVSPEPQFTVSPSDVTMTTWDTQGTTVTATSGVTGVSLNYSWKRGTTQLSAGSAYTPRLSDFGSAAGTYTVTCTGTVSGCSEGSSQDLTVTVKAGSCGNTYTDTRDNEKYPTVQVNSQCWMAKNMNYAGNGVQKYCYGNNSSNCSIYGGLYTWDAAMNGGQPGIKYVPGSNSVVQGICPDGWHIPGDHEWKVLEIALNMPQAQADAKDWRGSDQGRQLKSMEYWVSHSNSGTNSSKMEMRPGGWYTGGNYYSLGYYGGWWTSTGDGGSAWRRMLYNDRATADRNQLSKSYGLSIRCLRNYPSGIQVKAGTVSGPSTTCAGTTITLSSSAAASVSGGSAPLYYTWSVSTDGGSSYSRVPGTSAALSYKVENTSASPKTYVFRRQAYCRYGEASTEFSVKVSPKPQFTVSPSGVTMTTWDAQGTTVTATSVVTGVTLNYSWKRGTTQLSAGSAYTPRLSDFGNAAGTYTVTCTGTVSGCSEGSSQDLTVTVKAGSCGNTYTDTRDNEKYPTVQVNSQCWMSKNMNYAGNGVQKYCYGNSSSNCSTYGGLYTWDAAMNGGQSGIKYVPGSNSVVQGICPDGWHIPGDHEWKVLEMALGMPQAQADVKDWRGTDQGSQMKASGTYNGTLWCSGSSCNKSGMNMLPGGHRNNTGGTFHNLGTNGYWWSSTPDGSNGWRRMLYHDRATVNRYNFSKLFGFSVRCLRNYSSGIQVNAGTVSGPSTACAGTTITLSSSAAASVSGGSAPLYYTWSVSTDGGSNYTPVAEKTSATLSYKVENTSASPKTYMFRRQAYCRYGEASTEFSVKVSPKHEFTLSPSDVTMTTWDTQGSTVTATSKVAGVAISYSWKRGSTQLSAGSAYTPRLSDFGSAAGIYTVTCTGTVSGCSEGSLQNLTVTVKAGSCGDTLTDTRDNEKYPTVQVNSQCWMAENMNYAGNGVQKYCYGNNSSNCSIYGGLYTWDAAMNGGQSGIKYVPGSNSVVQGICPDGWHIPGDHEWKVLEMALGMPQAQAETRDWRGSDQGRQLKSMEYWTSHSNSGTNSRKMDMRPGGHRNNSGGSFGGLGTGGEWWSSTAYDGSNAWYKALNYGRADVYRGTNSKLFGFSIRCLKNYSSGIQVKAGVISGPSTACADATVTLSSSAAASVSGGSAPLYYAWSVSTDGGSSYSAVPGTSATLSYKVENTSASPKTYVFRRQAYCVYGEAYTEFSVKVSPKPQFTISPSGVTMMTWDTQGTTVTATSGVTGVTMNYSWKRGTTQLTTGSAYTPRLSDFGSTVGTYTVTCTGTVSGCSGTSSQNLTVTVKACGGNFTDTRSDGNGMVYPTVQIGEQCWMAKNMNVGTFVKDKNYNSHTLTGIQRYCYSNNESNCNTYGGLYTWNETVNGDKANAIKYVSGSSGAVQGICPDGWHVPSDAEWKTLEKNLGMTQSEIDKSAAWRGTNQGTQMKVAGTYNGYTWCSGSTCNKSGMNMLPGGYRNYTGGTFNYIGTRGVWWTSTVNDSSTAWRRRLEYSETGVGRNTYRKMLGFSVRCLKN